MVVLDKMSDQNIKLRRKHCRTFSMFYLWFLWKKFQTTVPHSVIGLTIKNKKNHNPLITKDLKSSVHKLSGITTYETKHGNTMGRYENYRSCVII